MTSHVKDAAERAGTYAGEKLREAGDAYSVARGKAAERLEGNPVAALIGAVALGVVAGALIPASRRENKLLAPIGSRLTQAGKVALLAARESGRERPGVMDVNREAGSGQLDRFIDIAIRLASVAITAAASASARK